ncbi:MAG TPA: cellulase family glycosylhydrolase [Candidatus Limnocylindria bacterium]|nr:cellulase family glycosylhydrolase [Candidatus Limnocylindria bacterium]
MTGFALGVNYWPASSAMRMWERFDAAEIAADFKRCADAGCDTVRFFLRWEDFQPDPTSVDDSALSKLRTVADVAEATGIGIIPTLFTGHMSGVNWYPRWALGSEPARRFRTIAAGTVLDRAGRDWAEPGILAAQALLARESARALAGHAALRMWDLGNENSNCWVPPTRDDGRRWLAAMAEAIRAVDASTPITIGLHAEDLEQDRKIGPAEAAAVCDVLSMHGYPMYLRWAGGRDDHRVLPFLADLTRWLGRKDVLFEEFGAPTKDPRDPDEARAADVLLDEDEAARYTARAIDGILAAGCTGALLWCYADYARAIWKEPPLDDAVHERHFGLWRSDGSPKPVVAELGYRSDAKRSPVPDDAWIDLRREDFYARPRQNLVKLYETYRTRP